MASQTASGSNGQATAEQLLEAGTAAAAGGDSPGSGLALNAEPLSLERVVSILAEKLVDWFDGAVSLLPNLMIAVVVLILGFAAGSILGKVSNKFFDKAVDSSAIANLLSAIIKVLVIAVGFFVALDLIGLQKAVVSLLAGAGIIGLAIGFAFQDLAENLLAGLLMGIRKPFEPGHLIESNGQHGFVQTLNLRNTIIRNFSGQIIYIPNKEVFKNVLRNYSKTGERRIEIPVGVSYGEDLRKVTETLRGAIGRIEGLKEGKEVEVYALEFGESSINFSVRYWIDYPRGNIGYFKAIDEGVKAIKEAFDESDILIPFPIRTLDFNARGGVNLGDSLPPALNKKEET